VVTFKSTFRYLLQNLIFECHAFGVVPFEPGFRGFLIGEDLEVVTVSDLLGGVDVDKNRHRRDPIC